MFHYNESEIHCQIDVGFGGTWVLTFWFDNMFSFFALVWNFYGLLPEHNKKKFVMNWNLTLFTQFVTV